MFRGSDGKNVRPFIGHSYSRCKQPKRAQNRQDKKPYAVEEEGEQALKFSSPKKSAFEEAK